MYIYVYIVGSGEEETRVRHGEEEDSGLDGELWFLILDEELNKVVLRGRVSEIGGYHKGTFGKREFGKGGRKSGSFW